MPRLTGSSTPQQLAPGYELTAPGLVGSVTEMTAEQSATRGDAGLHEPALLAALANAEVVPGKVFEIEVESETPALAGDGTRADGLTAETRGGEPAVVLTIPHLEEETDYAVLYTDEGGYTRWILPANPPAPDTPPGAPVRFKIVGIMQNSVLQGSLIVSEDAFIQRFPGQAGYQVFLIDAGADRVAARQPRKISYLSWARPPPSRACCSSRAATRPGEPLRRASSA